jgi:hypothetical protein
MSISWLESPLEADPVILMSFLRCVPVVRGFTWTCTPSTVARAVPIACLAYSCLATVQGVILIHISSCPSRFAAPLCLQCTQPQEAEAVPEQRQIPRNRCA